MLTVIPFPDADNAANVQLSDSRLFNALTRIRAKYGDRIDAIDRHRMAQHAELVVEDVRNDAADPTQGLFFARQLEHIYAEVLREPRPMQNALRLFGIDTTVKPGAKYHTIRRVYADGEAAVYAGRGESIPRVGMSKKEETFPVRHYVTSFVLDIFEMAAGVFANIQLATELLRIARDIIEEFINWQTWYGDVENGLFGVLNYPWIRKKVIATPFNETADPDEILRELHRFVNFPSDSQRQAFKPNVLVLSPRVLNYISQTPRSDTTDTTILGHFMANTKTITRVEEAHELQNDEQNPIPGVPPGRDAMLAYRDDRRGIQNVMPQTFTTLPTQEMGFEQVTFAYASHGGVVMRDVGNNIIGYVTPPDLF
jgi:hypothetical protein